jgi:phosphoribosylaminoimidazole-succinocarboxamide synthase
MPHDTVSVSEPKVQLYEGKAKIIYQGPSTDAYPNTVVQHFKDDVTAFNNQKHAVVPGKGVLNCAISSMLMQRLGQAGFPTHFIAQVGPRAQHVAAATMVPLEVVVRNCAAGSITKRLGFTEGWRFAEPLLEWYYKNDALGDPLLTEAHAIALGITTPDMLGWMARTALEINRYLQGYWDAVGITLVDFKVEFGWVTPAEGSPLLVLADEISPDSCRLWDHTTGTKLDKDVFRQNLGNIRDTYITIAERLGIYDPTMMQNIQ